MGGIMLFWFCWGVIWVQVERADAEEYRQLWGIEVPGFRNKKFSDGLIGNMDSRSLLHCGILCINAGACTSFTYNSKDGVCRLHETSLDIENSNCAKSDGNRFYQIAGTKETHRDCYELLEDGKTDSGEYSILHAGSSKDVYCDQDTSGGGWLVVQRRRDGSEDFNRPWNDYKQGFGHVSNEFWLGLEFLADITTQKNYTLRIDLENFENETRFAEYAQFTIGQMSTNYRLQLGNYAGTAGDGFKRHVGESFTTMDRDSDSYAGNCAEKLKGGWWYKSCQVVNLNGLYFNDGESVPFGEGISWRKWMGEAYSLKSTEMKIRPTQTN